uniref:Uncharacterized protein n=1 Tax=Panagrolaimus superbus TaxID=310955 RepID=A0A914XWU2_9BILA
MKVQQEEYVGWINTAALLVFVHPMDENIFQESLRYQVANGTAATVITNKVSYKRLGGNYGTCVTDSSEVEAYYYTGSYTSSGCLRGCYQDVVEEECGCMDPRYAKSAESSNCALNKWECVNNVTEQRGDSSNWETCICPSPCHESQYESRYGLSPFLYAPSECESLKGTDKQKCMDNYQDLAMVTVYVPTLTHKVFAETSKMTFNQFFSNVGGLAGVFIGFSIVTIVDFGFLFVLLGRIILGLDKEKKS